MYDPYLFIGLVVASIVFWFILLILASPEYEKMRLENLSKAKKNQILGLLHQSYLSRLSMYHEALIGSLFGLFVVYTVLTEKNLVTPIRLGALWVGIILAILTILLLGFTMVYYGAVQIVEESYEVDSAENPHLFGYFKQGLKKSLDVLNNIPFLGQKELSPRLVVTILAGFWFLILLPTILLMLMMY